MRCEHVQSRSVFNGSDDKLLMNLTRRQFLMNAAELEWKTGGRMMKIRRVASRPGEDLSSVRAER